MNKFIVDKISIQGYSHKISGKECQDSSICWQKKDVNGKCAYSAVIVCDGHGGEKYFRSALGSYFACEVGKTILSMFMEKVLSKQIVFNNVNYEKQSVQLGKAIIQSWNEKVLNHYKENPFNIDKRYEALSDVDKNVLIKNYVKAYGTTFIASIITNNFCYIIKLGDGNANLILTDGTVFTPQELEDENLQFNVTTSMCNSDASNDIKSFFYSMIDESRWIKKRKSLIGVVLTTDGVINCYSKRQSYISFIKNVVSAFREEQVGVAHNELIGVLNILSEKGSGDDLSIAIACKR